MKDSSRIKVLHVITRMVRGGAQRVLLDIVANLPRDQFEVAVAAGPQTGSEGSLWEEANGLGVSVHKLPYLVREISPLKDIRALRDLRRLIRDIRPHVVHSHTSKAGLLGSLAARKEGVKAIVYTPHGHIFGTDANIPGVPQKGLKRKILKIVRKLAHRYADITICLNEVDMRDHVKLRLCPKEKLRIIHNGVDTHRFQPVDEGARVQFRESLGLKASGIVIAFVARLTEEKGVRVLSEAWKRVIQDVADARMIVAGDGPLEGVLQGREDEGIHLLGFHENVRNVFAASDLLCVPSYYESQGLVALEAMSCGVPVVASDVGGLPTVVHPGKNGWLFETGDEVAVASTLIDAIRDTASREAYGSKARDTVVDGFSIEENTRRHVELYNKIVGAAFE